MKEKNNNQVMTEADEKYCVASYMFFGKGEVRRDSALGIAYAKQAANLGSIEAHRLLGKVYGNGLCFVEKDPEEAVRWLEKVADKGDAQAHINLGCMLWKSDDAKALEHLHAAEDMGKADGRCYSTLAAIYLSSRKVEHDFDKAFRYAKLAVAAGEFYCVAHLAHHYRYGLGVEKDVLLADCCYSLLAAHTTLFGGVGLIHEAGMIEYEGEVEKADYGRAFKHFSVAASHGYVPSMQMLAKMYKKGQGTKPNRAEARRWREEADRMQKGESLFPIVP